MGHTHNWIANGLWRVGFGVFMTLAQAVLARTAVEAEFHWRGTCDNRTQLELELQERGVELTPSSSTDPHRVPLQLWVSVNRSIAATTAAQGADVDANTMGGEGAYLAELTLADRYGHRETRRVEVAECAQLQAALAVILASFAQAAHSQEPGPNQAALQASLPEPRISSLPAADTAPMLVEPTPAVRIARESLPRIRVAAESFELRPETRPASSRFGALSLGAQLVSGLGWVDSVSLGAAVYFEWQPRPRSPISLRSAFVAFPTLTFEHDQQRVVLRRRFGSMALVANLPIPHLRCSLAGELGDTAADTPDLRQHTRDHAPWFALVPSVHLELPIVERKLALEFSTGAAYAPARYSLQYLDSERVILNTRSLEWRATLGMRLRVAPAFP
jgi:hypothetical protein